MRLLVSVLSAVEAAEAVTGGAHIVDVKNPAEGALGAPAPWVIEQVRAAVPRGLAVSAAVGDLPNLPGTAALAALGAARCGAAYVKVGLRGPMTEAEAVELLRQVRRAVSGCPGVCVVPAAYADVEQLGGRLLSPLALPRVARAAEVEGCMVDTAVKDGRSLFDWLSRETLAALVAEAHAAGLWVALAGSLRMEDLPVVQALSADVVGVRSAACRDSHRSGPLEAARVRHLRAAIAG